MMRPLSSRFHPQFTCMYVYGFSLICFTYLCFMWKVWPWTLKLIGYWIEKLEFSKIFTSMILLAASCLCEWQTSSSDFWKTSIFLLQVLSLMLTAFITWYFAISNTLTCLFCDLSCEMKMQQWIRVLYDLKAWGLEF